MPRYSRPWSLEAARAFGAEPPEEIVPPPPFITITLAPIASLVRGQSTQVLVTITRNRGFKGAVTLTPAGLPSGVSGGAVVIGPGSTIGHVTLVAAADAPLTVDPFTVAASGVGVPSVTDGSVLTVLDAPAFAITVDLATSASLQQGQSTTLGVTITRLNGYTGSVTVALSNLPTGVSASPVTIASGQTVASFALSATSSAAVGVATITGTASGSGVLSVSDTASITVTAAPVPAITVDASSTVSVQQGSSAILVINITRVNGFIGGVNIIVSGLPSGVSASPLTIASDETSGLITLTASLGATVGTSTPVVSASAAGVTTRTDTFSLTVAIFSDPGDPPAGTTVPLSATRWLPGTATTVLMGWVPLLPGELSVANWNSGKGRLLLAGTEVVGFQALPVGPGGYHSDGTPKFVRIQHTRSLAQNAVLNFEYDLTGSRAFALAAEASPHGELYRSGGADLWSRGPAGGIVCTDGARICGSKVIALDLEPDVTFGTKPAWMTELETIYTTLEPTTTRTCDWSISGNAPGLPSTAWTATNQGVGSGGVGPVAVYEAHWELLTRYARTGDPVWWHRAISEFAEWRRYYLANADGTGRATGEPFVQPKMAACAYWLLGDTAMREVLMKWVDEARWNTAYYNFGLANNYGVGRFGARALECAVLGYAIGIQAADDAPGTYPLDSSYWNSVLSRTLNEVGATYPVVAPHAWTTGLAGAGGLSTLQISFDDYSTFISFPFQFSILARALIEYYERIEQRATILTRLEEYCDSLIGPFKYNSATDGYSYDRLVYDSASGVPAPDLNAFPAGIFWWMGPHLVSAGKAAKATTYKNFAVSLYRAYSISPYTYSSGGTTKSGSAGPDWIYPMPKSWMEFSQYLGLDFTYYKRAVQAGA